MAADDVYPPPPALASTAHVDAAAYQAMYAASVQDPVRFWGEQGRRLDWITPYTVVKNTAFDPQAPSIRWFEDGALNVCANCVDRHVATRGDQMALIWEGDDPAISDHITYAQLYDRVRRFANILKELDVAKGDRVALYLPMIPEAVYAMLACARIGAVHVVVGGGAPADALAHHVAANGAKLVVTADEGVRGGRTTPLKAHVDAARAQVPYEVRCLVVHRTGAAVDMHVSHDFWYHEALNKVALNCLAEPMNAEDPLFVLADDDRSAPSTGVVHSSGGYLVYAAITHQYVFDHQPGDIYWCAADVGSIVGHSYLVYGPLANGATSVLFEGAPNYPEPGRLWRVCEKHAVATLYLDSEEVAAQMAADRAAVSPHDLSSLRILGSFGAPMRPDAWGWLFDVVGKRRAPIIDTWCRPETGGVVIAPLPGATTLKPGAATRPFFGVQPCVLDLSGQEILALAATGALAFKDSWPGQMRAYAGDHGGVGASALARYPGFFATGETCRRDADGDYWITSQ